MKRFTFFIVAIVALTLLTAPAWGQSCNQSADEKLAATQAPAPKPIYPTPRAEWSWGADGFEKGGGWVLICPAGCKLITTPPNHHGEVRQYCDCDGDGRQDEDCQVWIRTDADGGQNLFCTQFCPEGQQCSMITVEKPDGDVFKFCDCI